MTTRSLRGPNKAKASPRVARGANFVLLCIGLFGGFHLAVMLGVEVGRYGQNASEIARFEREIEILERERSQLQAILDHADDIRYRELLARRQGFIYPDERRFVTVR